VKVVVDMDICEFHGQCAIAAPDVFELKDDETLLWNATPDESLRADVEAAVDGCPTQAISIAED
jgi:ferredoxin